MAQVYLDRAALFFKTRRNLELIQPLHWLCLEKKPRLLRPAHARIATRIRVTLLRPEIVGACRRVRVAVAITAKSAQMAASEFIRTWQMVSKPTLCFLAL